jgi:geranylgeranyl diphosphate synthase type I
MISAEHRDDACDTEAMSADLVPQPPPALAVLRAWIDATLRSFLADVREEMSAVAPDALLPVDEVIRLIDAGGKRLRPAFCYWGYRAAGGLDGEPIVRAAAALELLHTMALIHDDVMDRSPERRGIAASVPFLADRSRRDGASDPEHAGTSLALLAGDLAAVLADRLLLTSGFEPDRLVPALDRYHRMRTEMALGQALDLAGGGEDETAASLKGGSYTVEGPLVIGATLAAGDAGVVAALAAYGASLGLAFQLLDDERDGERALVPGRVATLVGLARIALDSVALDPDAAVALRALSDLVASG